jgi:hypothetical protein
MSLSTIAFRS